MGHTFYEMYAEQTAKNREKTEIIDLSSPEAKKRIMITEQNNELLT